ncbi:MAG: hypothetical protein DVB23_002105 [Verrucomicrobia bacterium]|nr:MAG: hypothetical protein DVB23_002105 [Verrucomicrobiota bacterium]
MNRRWRDLSRGPALVFLVLLVAGLVRAPLESRLLRDLRQAGFHPPLRGSSALQEVGVQGMMGALGGLRYMVSTFLTLRANFHWEFQDWENVLQNYRLVQVLEPRNPDVWITGAWHCHSNAWAWYLQDDPAHSEVTRRLLAREWLERGKEMLRQGIEWNPENPWIWRDLANLYREREGNLCEAAECYRRASLTPGAPDFLHRIYGYLLAQCGEHDEEAMKVLRGIYDEGLEVLRRQRVMIWKPSLIVEMRKLEARLGVPPESCIPERFDAEGFVIATPLLPKESLPIYERLLEKSRGPNPPAPDPALATIVARLREQLDEKSAVP